MELNKIASILVITCAVLGVFTSGSYAFDQTHLEKLMSTKTCQACDLTNANLSKLDLKGAKLMETNLTGANLTNTNLTGAQLYFADLTGANITGTRFSGAQLTNAIWVDGRQCAHGSLGRCRKE
jgi:uncharacterized protein YjbI with pentapeptide repeats